MVAEHPHLSALLFGFLSKYVSLTEEEKALILSLDLFRTEKKGTVLLQAGQHSPYIYLVLKGCIRVYYPMDGEEKTTALYTEMEGMTPHCTLTNAPSEYCISCVEDAVLVVADVNMEAEILRRYPTFERLCRVFSEELVAKQQLTFDAFKLSSPEERYQNLLQTRPDLIQRVPQHQLASYLGIKPQSLSRLRARMLAKDKQPDAFLHLSERA